MARSLGRSNSTRRSKLERLMVKNQDSRESEIENESDRDVCKKMELEGLFLSSSSSTSLLVLQRSSSSSSSSPCHFKIQPPKKQKHKQQQQQLKLKPLLVVAAAAAQSSSSLHHQQQDDMRSSIVSKVAVVGGGISGCVCASSLAAKYGISVTLFESGRGPGGRTSQRREIAQDDGKEFSFDHGAPFFTVTNNVVMDLVRQWEAKGFLAQWRQNFGYFDCSTAKFVDFDDKEGSNNNKYVGTPGMNSICKALCREPGVDAKFGVTVGSIKWLEDKNLWSLTDSDGKILGNFDGVVASDKNIVSSAGSLVGRPPPLDISLCPELAVKLQEIPVLSCFALMLAFPEPLSSIPVRGILFQNSEVLSWAFCDSSKPGRSASSECWVLHSTADYARNIIAQYGLQKPSSSLLTKVAEELFREFQNTKLHIPKPLFMKAHRWGSAFPAKAVAEEEKCLWDSSKRLAVCGDFCVSPNIEGAILSGIAAASKFSISSTSTTLGNPCLL